MTGLEWVRESGLLTTPIGPTNTSQRRRRPRGVDRGAQQRDDGARLDASVVAETCDGFLNDIDGFHVRASTSSRARLGGRRAGRRGQRRRRHRDDLPRLQGRDRHGLARGGGAGRSACSSRRTTARRSRLAVDGVPVGRALAPTIPPASPGPTPRRLDHRRRRDRRAAAPAPVRRLAQRAALGDRAHGRRGRELERRPRARVLDRERARRQPAGAARRERRASTRSSTPRSRRPRRRSSTRCSPPRR